MQAQTTAGQYSSVIKRAPGSNQLDTNSAAVNHQSHVPDRAIDGNQIVCPVYVEG